MPPSLDICRNKLYKIGYQSKIIWRNKGLSDQWAVEPMGCRTNGLSNQWAVGSMCCGTNGLSDYWDVTSNITDFHVRFFSLPKSARFRLHGKRA